MDPIICEALMWFQTEALYILNILSICVVLRCTQDWGTWSVSSPNSLHEFISLISVLIKPICPELEGLAYISNLWAPFYSLCSVQALILSGVCSCYFTLFFVVQEEDWAFKPITNIKWKACRTLHDPAMRNIVDHFSVTWSCVNIALYLILLLPMRHFTREPQLHSMLK